MRHRRRSNCAADTCKPRQDRKSRFGVATASGSEPSTRPNAAPSALRTRLRPQIRARLRARCGEQPVVLLRSSRSSAVRREQVGRQEHPNRFYLLSSHNDFRPERAVRRKSREDPHAPRCNGWRCPCSPPPQADHCPQVPLDTVVRSVPRTRQSSSRSFAASFRRMPGSISALDTGFRRYDKGFRASVRAQGTSERPAPDCSKQTSGNLWVKISPSKGRTAV
jgi:hypothetical protein